MQEHRIAMGNQILALEKAEEETQPLEDYFKRFYDIEKDIAKHIAIVVKDEPMYEWLKSVKGIGAILAAALLSSIDIAKTQHASSVWKYAGLAPGQKRQRGKKLDFNPFLKKTCWLIGESFVKTKGEYRGIYDTSKMMYKNKFPKKILMVDEKGKPILTRDGKKRYMYSDGHLHNMAKRRCVKLFLSNFWAAWREEEGLPVSVPFMHRGEN